MQPPTGYQPLSPSDFEFFGYDTNFPELRRKVERLGICSGEPSIAVFEDIVFIPSPGRNRSEPLYTGGFTSSGGEPFAWSGLRRKGTQTIASLPERVELDSWEEFDGEILYLGWLFGHFGHMMVESLARAWAIASFPAALPILFHAPGAKLPEGVVQHVLDWFGISASRILMPVRPTRFRRVVVPQPLHELHASVHERFPEPYRDVTHRILAEGPAGTSDQPVYISRRYLQNDKRPLTGERELEEVLQENGFLVARPEVMTFADQVRLFNRHRDIVAVEGSAINQVLFALGQPHIHCIAPWEVPLGDYFLLPRVSGAATTIISGASENLMRSPTTRQGPQLLNLSRLFDYFEEQGYLKRLLRADLARRLNHLERQYEDTALFHQIMSAYKGATPLPPALAREAECRADSDWPISAALSYFYRDRDAMKCEQFAQRFVELANVERELDRLARYHADIKRMMPAIAQQCHLDLGNEVRRTVEDKFCVRV